MSNQLYKVRLAPGFNAKRRNRAGLSFAKNTTSVLELTEEQLAALKEDVWFVVEKAPKDAEATEVTEAPTNTATEDAGQAAAAGADEEEVVEPYAGVSFKDLKAQATEAGLDIKGLKSRADVIAVLDANKNQDPAGGTSYEEHVEDGIRYFKWDGDKICAVQDDNFENLEESLAGFGETEAEALAELNKAIELADNLDEEEVTISEDMPLEDLQKIATEQGVDPKFVEASTEETKAELIKAIEEASAETEE